MNKQEYDQMLGINNYEPKHITRKERLMNEVRWIYKYQDKEIRHLNTRQLLAMIKKNDTRLLKNN